VWIAPGDKERRGQGWSGGGPKKTVGEWGVAPLPEGGEVTGLPWGRGGGRSPFWAPKGNYLTGSEGDKGNTCLLLGKKGKDEKKKKKKKKTEKKKKKKKKGDCQFQIAGKQESWEELGMRRGNTLGTAADGGKEKIRLGELYRSRRCTQTPSQGGAARRSAHKKKTHPPKGTKSVTEKQVRTQGKKRYTARQLC